MLADGPTEMPGWPVAGLNVQGVGEGFFVAHATPMACPVTSFHLISRDERACTRQQGTPRSLP
jgi:hypothetical protein